MIRSLALCGALVASLGAPSRTEAVGEAPRSSPSVQEARKYTLKASVVEVVPKEKDPPGFLCEGTTDLPDGARIDLYTYFLNPDPTGLRKKEPEQGKHRYRTAVPVKDGRFSASFSLFQEKNLSGDYVFRVVFDPNLQVQHLSTLPTVQSDVPLPLGKPGDAERDRAAWGARLFGEIKAVIAIADEVAARRKSDLEKGTSDPAAWAGPVRDWTDRLRGINERVHKAPEYLVLEMSNISDSGLDALGHLVLDLARSGSLGRDKGLREGRERIDLMVSNYEHELTRPPDPRQKRIDLAHEARGLLEAAVRGPGDRAGESRKRFKQVLFDIHALAQADVQALLRDLMAQATEIFDALDEKKDVQAKVQSLQARLEELEKSFQNPK